MQPLSLSNLTGNSFFRELKQAPENARKPMLIENMLNAGYASLSAWSRQWGCKYSTIWMAIDLFCKTELLSPTFISFIRSLDPGLVAKRGYKRNSTNKNTLRLRHHLSECGYASISAWAKKKGYKPDTVLKTIQGAFWVERKNNRDVLSCGNPRIYSGTKSAIIMDLIKTLKMEGVC